MAELNFSKPVDEVLMAVSVLRRMGYGKLDSFDNRIRNQKIQYLAQLFGISPHYTYNLYIRGPYSPDLCRDLFNLAKSELKINTNPFGPHDLEERFCKLKNFVKGTTIRELELITTFHWLKSAAKLTHRAAINKLIELKEPSQEDLDKVQRKVGELI